MTLIYSGCFILAALLWGDWRNWRKYYPTILFLYVVNLLAEIFTYNYTLWKFKGTIPYLPNHTPTSLEIILINFTCSLLIFLGRYPRRQLHQVLWIMLWISINSLLEWNSLRLHHIVYEHGWSFGWSIVLNSLFYPIVRLHYLRPLWAWAVTIMAFVFFVMYFGIPIQSLK